MSSKKFKEGMAVGAKPFEEKFKIQSDAIERIGKSIDKKMDEFSEINEVIINDLSSIEKKRLYDLNTAIDIAELDSTEKEFLLALIYTISNMSEGTTEFQKCFVRSVKNYLDIASPQTEVRISSIENIENINTQKAILQTVMEFLFLKHGDHSYLEDYKELMSYFSVNSRGIEEIKKSINKIHSATGFEGISEKYGYIPVDPPSDSIEDIVKEENFEEEICWEDFGKGYPEVILSEEIEIEAGETKTFENSIVHVRSDINCKGSLVFKSCVVHYNELGSRGEISLAENASMEISSSKVVCNDFIGKYFIDAGYDTEIDIRSCRLENCGYFIISNVSKRIIVERCKLLNPIMFIDGYVKEGGIASSFIIFKNFTERVDRYLEYEDNGYLTLSILSFRTYLDYTGFNVKNCTIKNQDSFFKNIDYIFNIEHATFENCSFENCSWESTLSELSFIDRSGTCINDASKIIKSSFKGCTNSITLMSLVLSDILKNIDDCTFENCKNIISGSNLKVSNCQFIDCEDYIVSTGFNGNIKVISCEFYNIDLINGTGLYFHKSKDRSYSNTSEVKDCLFDGIHARDNFLIVGNIHEKISGTAVDIWNCTFRNCITENRNSDLIKEYGHYYGLLGKRKELKIVFSSGCDGLDQINKQQREFQKVTARTETALGEKIGASISK